jgi:hypothetical protein
MLLYRIKLKRFQLVEKMKSFLEVDFQSINLERISSSVTGLGSRKNSPTFVVTLPISMIDFPMPLT